MELVKHILVTYIKKLESNWFYVQLRNEWILIVDIFKG